MPIKGVTYREERFPEIGHIRKGSPKNENGHIGKDLDYFRVTFDAREVDAAKKFQSIYGDKPQEINVVLAFDEVDKVWDAYLEAYVAGRMVARSDGEKYLYLVDTKTGEVVIKNGEPYRAYKEGEVIGTYTNSNTKKTEKIIAKPVGRLRVVIPELQRLAYLTVLTSSIHDIVNISSQIKAIAAINGGKISGIHMTLKRRPKEISIPRADGTRARYVKWMLSIEASPEWVGAKLSTMAALSMPESAVGYLPAGELPAKPEIANESVMDEPYHDEEIPDDEIQDGDFEDAPSEPPAQSQPQDQQKTAETIYEPAQLKARLAQEEDRYEELIARGEAMTNGQEGILINTHIEQAFKGDKDAAAKRHAVLEYLTGSPSVNSLNGPMKLALKHWLNAKQNPVTKEWVHRKECDIEIIHVYQQTLLNQGQQQLPL